MKTGDLALCQDHLYHSGNSEKNSKSPVLRIRIQHFIWIQIQVLKCDCEEENFVAFFYISLQKLKNVLLILSSKKLFKNLSPSSIKPLKLGDTIKLNNLLLTVLWPKQNCNYSKLNYSSNIMIDILDNVYCKDLKKV
jgi:hypothetical protein